MGCALRIGVIDGAVRLTDIISFSSVELKIMRKMREFHHTRTVVTREILPSTAQAMEVNCHERSSVVPYYESIL